MWAAFDMLDIPTIVRRLECSFGIFGAMLAWIKGYLPNRCKFIKVGKARSPSEVYNLGVPQGSVLCLLIFTLYVISIGNYITSFRLDFHQYADDIHIYIALDRPNVDAKLRDLEDCSRADHDWFMIGTDLHSTPDKTIAMVL